MNRRAVIQKLESLGRAGITHLPKRVPTAAEEPTIAEEARQGTPAATIEITPVDRQAREADMAQTTRRKTKQSATAELDIIRQEVASCTLCSELASTRTQTVFGVGNPRAKLCFLGEAPGADEDRLGEPFVGRAGKLLTDIIQDGMGLSREDIYILNILKCRPPGNRNPAPEEAAHCRQFLDRQLAAIQPEFLCLLGAVAAHNLLETTTPIGRMRGQWYDYQGIRVMCTYHPAYLLRNPPAKKDTWQDIQMLMGEMGLEVPPRA